MYNKIKSTIIVLLIFINTTSNSFANKIEVVYLQDWTCLKDTNKVGKRVKASYPGGEKELFKYLAESIRYPAKTRANNIEGRVIVEFTVTKEGLVSDPTIIVGLDQFCDKEVIRVVNEMPKWIPATQDGVPIDSKVKLPASFRSEHVGRKNEYFLDSKSISEKQFAKLTPQKIKTMVIERTEFSTKMDVFTFKMLKTPYFEIQNISYVENTVGFDVITLPENGIIKAEIIDGNGKPIATKMIIEPKSINDLKLSFPSTAKKPIFLGINQLGTTMNINLTD
jgi:TonB family protein